MAFLHLLTDSKLAAVKADGHAPASALDFDLSTAVTLTAQAGSPIGAAEAIGKLGADKKADAIAAVVPTVSRRRPRAARPSWRRMPRPSPA